MSIYDREYMRKDDDSDWWKPGSSLKRWLKIGILAVSLLASVIWLARSAGIWPSHRATSYEKQSLVVNINSASLEELQTLPGIGPVRANAVIANRPYQTVDELRKVSGISERQLKEMRAFVKIDGRSERTRRK